MRLITDLHIHSRYSRACSKQLTVENIARWCDKKGIGLVGTGDFTHPSWFAEMRKVLRPHESGFYTTADAKAFVVPTAEISCIYSRGGKVRRVHIVVIAPSLNVVARINKQLDAIGNIKSDGRPILGLDVEKLTKIVLDTSDQCLVIPAHAWTPWFSVFGSKSGFDSLEECFGEMTRNIYAIETGLSSDPAMNWRLSALDHVTLLSNSDAHSLQNLAREANVFELPTPTYAELIDAIRTKNPKCILSTIEFYPEEGKYHVDGHGDCGVRCTPEETKKWKGRCPKCGKLITVGVLNRVAVLADRPMGYRPTNAIPYKSIVPLQEIIAEAYGVGKQSKRVQKTYEEMMVTIAPEFSLLLDISLEKLREHNVDAMIVEGIRRVRAGEIMVAPGYDGIFGTVEIGIHPKKKTTAVIPL